MTRITRTITLATLFTTATLLLPVAVGLRAAPGRGADAATIASFTRAVNDYALLQKRLSEGLPRIEVSSDPQKIIDAVDALAGAIQTARAGAREGDILSPAVGTLFRRLIQQTLREHDLDISALLAELASEAPPDVPTPGVNDRFPWSLGAATPVDILAVLPTLPEGLQYHFVGRDLILVDILANLVVDVLRSALPRAPVDPFSTGAWNRTAEITPALLE